MTVVNPRTLLGRFVLERLLAQHGLDETWAAFDRDHQRHVAVRLLPGDTIRAPGVIAAAARVQSAHVEPIYEHGRDENGNDFFVTELLEGEYLDVRLCTTGTLTLQEAAPVVAQVADGLDAVHAAGLVHNSIKPARIFLARTAAGESARLAYGICLVQWSGSDVKTKVGSPPYMSPEQVRTGMVSPQSDVWALAVTSYEVLTGQLPFAGGSTDELGDAICNATPTPPSHLVAALGSELDQCFDRALAKDPAQRFSSAKELAGALATLMNQVP